MGEALKTTCLMLDSAVFCFMEGLSPNAWNLWQQEGFESPSDAEDTVLSHASNPDLSSTEFVAAALQILYMFGTSEGRDGESKSSWTAVSSDTYISVDSRSPNPKRSRLSTPWSIYPWGSLLEFERAWREYKRGEAGVARGGGGPMGCYGVWDTRPSSNRSEEEVIRIASAGSGLVYEGLPKVDYGCQLDATTGFF